MCCSVSHVRQSWGNCEFIFRKRPKIVLGVVEIKQFDNIRLQEHQHLIKFSFAQIVRFQVLPNIACRCSSLIPMLYQHWVNITSKS